MTLLSHLEFSKTEENNSFPDSILLKMPGVLSFLVPVYTVSLFMEVQNLTCRAKEIEAVPIYTPPSVYDITSILQPIGLAQFRIM